MFRHLLPEQPAASPEGGQGHRGQLHAAEEEDGHEAEVAVQQEQQELQGEREPGPPGPGPGGEPVAEEQHPSVWGQIQQLSRSGGEVTEHQSSHLNIKSKFFKYLHATQSFQ